MSARPTSLEFLQAVYSNEELPLSVRLRTVKVLGTVRSSSDSRISRTAMARLRNRVGQDPFSVPDGTRRERADRSQDDRRIAKTPWEDWSAIQWRDILPGAQTERRGDAGPVRGLLGGKDLTGYLLSRRTVFQTVLRINFTNPSPALRRPKASPQPTRWRR